MPLVAPLADGGFGHLGRQRLQARNSAALAEVEVVTGGRQTLACAQMVRLLVEGGIAEQAAQPRHVESPYVGINVAAANAAHMPSPV